MLSVNTARSQGWSGFTRCSRSPRPSASWMSAACTRMPSSSPSVSTATCRLRPFSRLAASQPRGPPLSVVFTLWVPTTAAVGLGSRPAPSRSMTTRWWRMLSHTPSRRNARDPPPPKWSAPRYGFEPEEDRDGEQEAQARGGGGQAAAGGRPGLAGAVGGGGDPGDRGDGGDVLPLAAGVRGPEVGPGEAAEGPG